MSCNSAPPPGCIQNSRADSCIQHQQLREMCRKIESQQDELTRLQQQMDARDAPALPVDPGILTQPNCDAGAGASPDGAPAPACPGDTGLHADMWTAPPAATTTMAEGPRDMDAQNLLWAGGSAVLIVLALWLFWRKVVLTR